MHKKIETDEEYEAVVDEIEALVEAIEGTPDFKELDRLIALVNEYESDFDGDEG